MVCPEQPVKGMRRTLSELARCQKRRVRGVMWKGRERLGYPGPRLPQRFSGNLHIEVFAVKAGADGRHYGV